MEEEPILSSQYGNQDASSIYGDAFRELYNQCKDSIVFLSLFQKNSPKLTFIATGIIIASGNDFCCIATVSDVKRENEECTVHFPDSNKIKVATSEFSVSLEYKMATLLLKGDNMKYIKHAVTFSNAEISMHGRVATCGFNSRWKERSFMSESLVSSVGVKVGDMAPDATCFSHSCAVDSFGDHGSAVLNEHGYLVGMNIFYLYDKDHEQEESEHDKQRRNKSKVNKEKARAESGFVVALNLESITHVLANIYPHTKGMIFKRPYSGEGGPSSS